MKLQPQIYETSDGGLEFTTQKMKFSIKDFFSKSHIFCAVNFPANAIFLYPNTHNEENTNKLNSSSATLTFWKCDHSKLTFCTKLAKMNISVAKIFTQKNFWSFKTTFTKYWPSVYAITIPSNIDIKLKGKLRRYYS